MDLNTFVTKIPPFLKNYVASLNAANTNSVYEKASITHEAPTFGAPSFNTTSAFPAAPISFLIYLQSITQLEKKKNLPARYTITR